MTVRSIRKVVCLALISFATSASGQATKPRAAPPATPPTDDIVVTGLRDLDLNDPNAPVTHETLGSNRTGHGAIASRSAFAVSERFARCAVTTDSAAASTPHDALRRALDGAINGAGQRFWQSRFIGIKSTCAQDPQIARLYGLASADGTYYDTTYYDRGAMYVRAIQVFAPGLTMTKAQTADPVVHQRFNAREVPLARYRLPVDRRYFEIAVCLVRMEPELSVRLVQTQRTDLFTKLEAAIVGRSPVCVGGARKVYFDPAQFRMYIADAVYRWAVAVKGLDSLIPVAK